MGNAVVPHVVVMGVAGCGKSTVGAKLADRLQRSFVEADDLHDAASREKMSKGIALTDHDRNPWLVRIGDHLNAMETPAIASCSALRRCYRDTLRQRLDRPVIFAHLACDKQTITRRFSARRGHFMPASLIESQFATLEELDADEQALVLDATMPIDELVAMIAPLAEQEEQAFD